MTTTEFTIEDWQRHEILRQIGGGNILSISGGRAIPTARGVRLHCGNGYRVDVDLTPADDYTVRRVFARGGREWVKGEQERVYCSEVGEAAYRAGMFRDPWPAGGVT